MEIRKNKISIDEDGDYVAIVNVEKVKEMHY